MKKQCIVSVLLSSFLFVPTISFAQSLDPAVPEAIPAEADENLKPDDGIQDYGFKAKALKYALKAGGWALSQIIDGLVSEAEGRIIREFSDEIADALDVPGDILEDIIYDLLTDGGVEENLARNVASVIAFIAL